MKGTGNETWQSFFLCFCFMCLFFVFVFFLFFLPCTKPGKIQKADACAQTTNCVIYKQSVSIIIIIIIIIINNNNSNN